MAKKPDLSIIILNYNTKELLRECLKSVISSQRLATRKKPITHSEGISRSEYHHSPITEIIVVDNASTDGSPAMVKKEFPEIKLVESKKNLGFAAGNNLGIPHAQGRYVLFLNPDTKVFPDTFKTTVRFMDEHPKAGAVTCRVELPSGKLDDACHRGFPTPWNAFAHFSGLAKIFPKSRFFAGYSLGYLPKNKIHQIDSGCGAFLMSRRLAGSQVGWWDEDYFWYGEDLDFCYRLKEKGWKIFFVPQTKIIHYKGVASGIKKHTQKITTATKETRIRAVKASTEVMRIFFRKHYQKKYSKLLYWLVMSGIDFLEKVRLLKVSR